MKKQIDYIVIVQGMSGLGASKNPPRVFNNHISVDVTRFASTIIEKMQEGYVCQGGITLEDDGSKYQAMVKYED